MKCRRCKVETEDYIRDSVIHNKRSGKIYSYYSCLPCNTEHAKKYRTTEKGKAAIKRATNKYEENNPQRVLAWHTVQNRPKKFPLGNCLICGTDAHIHRHHPDIKLPEFVVSLCALHHKRVHKGLLSLDNLGIR